MKKWRIINIDNRYEISNLGEVRNIKTKRILKPFKTTNGYMRIRFGGKAKQVHCLIAEHFILNPDNYQEVNHINGNKLDNSISNLEWTNRSLNVKHAYDHNLAPKGNNRNDSKLNEDSVKKIKYILKNYQDQTLSSIARKFNVSPSTIWSIRENKSWKHVKI